MGRRGEIFTRKIFVKEGEKTYFFNIKENRYGDAFLNIVESSKKEGGGFQRNSIMVYREDLMLFQEGFRESSEHLKKRDKTSKLSLEKGNEGARRKYHFSVKWNKFGWGSIFVAEERAQNESERRNESLLIDERDMEDFMLGFEPVIARFKRLGLEKRDAFPVEKKEAPEEKKKVRIKKAAPPAQKKSHR